MMTRWMRVQVAFGIIRQVSESVHQNRKEENDTHKHDYLTGTCCDRRSSVSLHVTWLDKYSSTDFVIVHNSAPKCQNLPVACDPPLPFYAY